MISGRSISAGPVSSWRKPSAIGAIIAATRSVATIVAKAVPKVGIRASTRSTA